MRRLALRALLLVPLVFFAAFASQARPARIISVIPAVTEILFALGAGHRIVGVGSFDRFPPEVASIPKVGALLDPDLERILSLQPDLVVIYGSQADLKSQLTRAKIAVHEYRHGGLADVPAAIRSVGNRIGLATEAAKLAGEIESGVDAIRRRTSAESRPKTLIVMGRESGALRGIYASGGVGFIHDMVTVAGGQNVFADVKREAVQATTEQILSRKPEVVIELRADPLTADEEKREIAAWRQLPALPAVKSGRIHIIVDARTVIPGPRVVEGIEAIAARLRQR